MQKYPTKIYEAWILIPKVFFDERGFFLESWNRETFRAIGIDVDFVQDNHSRSGKNVLRGLHYQAGASAQGKLVWVTSGTVFDVIVDLRLNSPSYGIWESYLLTADTHKRLWIPPGCAHGFMVVSEVADFHYKCTKPYDPRSQRTLKWNDATLGVQWPLGPELQPVVSTSDAAGASFTECEKYAQRDFP